MSGQLLSSLFSVALLFACSPPAVHDVVVRNGTIYDGSGGPGYSGGVAIDAGRIVGVGDLGNARGRDEVDATGLAVAPGFINVLSWASGSLFEDNRYLSDLKQGVTLEILGEGASLGPFNEAQKKERADHPFTHSSEVVCDTLGEYLDQIVERGSSLNVASLVGATTVRVYVLGYEDLTPDAEELARMQDLVRQAMEEGALGVGVSLGRFPALYATTEELTALARAVGEYGGSYASHLRNQGTRLLEAIDEHITITREAGVSSEIYHLKASGKSNWDKLDGAIAKIEQARAEGLQVNANIYPYTAGAGRLWLTLPPWAREGGRLDRVARLKDPEIRRRLRREMMISSDEWENRLLESSSPGETILMGFGNPELRRKYSGKTLEEVAADKGMDFAETIIDLMIGDESGLAAIYFLMSEKNVREKIALPWVSFGSDADAPAAEGADLTYHTHPRAYGTFARVLGHYVRDEGLIPLAEAIRRLTSLPAASFKLRERGALKEGYWADVVVFDPETIQDRATYRKPHQYATGVRHVLVNGTFVLRDGEHTGATPGQVVRGPGWKGWEE